MPEEQLSALLAKLKEDAGLRAKLQCAGNLDTALAIAKEAGYEVTTEEWLKHHEYLSSELSDHDLEGLSGGNGGQDRKETKRISCKNS